MDGDAEPRAATETDISLRPVGEKDLEVLFRLTGDPDSAGETEWYGWRNPLRHRRRWEENGMLGDEAGMLMVVRHDQVLGLVSWHKVLTGAISYCWNIGIALLPEARGRGYGSAAQRELVRYLFSHTQVYRIEASTNVANVAEQRALEKAGFTREGVVRGAAFQGGRWHDGVTYSVLRPEVDL